MLAQPSSGPRGGNEDSARQMLDTVASVAADPAGYKKRLAELDEATKRADEAKAAALTAQKQCFDMQEELRAQVAEIDRGKADLEAERRAFSDRSAKSAKQLAEQCKAAEETLQRREAEIKAKSDQTDDLNTRLQSREAELNTAIATAKAEAERNRVLNGQLEKALAVAADREDAAKKAIARVKALASES